jgi:hypothetical protein
VAGRGEDECSIALLEAENDCEKKIISYARIKTRELAFVTFGSVAETIRKSCGVMLNI